MKYEWRKKEKALYLPGKSPELVNVPEMGFFVVHGEGNPNGQGFADRVQALYSLSYAIRMSHKGEHKPAGYFEYAVYPLEGIWDVSEQEKKSPSAKLNKNQLVYDIMIRQPHFVTEEVAIKFIALTKENKPSPALDRVRFERMTEGQCVQMLHLGPYDEEPASFKKMETWATGQGLKRRSKIHREIYLTDARKTAPEKQKTILRFNVD